jgi:glycosyltransferase involved in cell wall biosynthesis
MENWLRAAAKVANEVDAQFIVGGEGTDRPRLEALANHLGIGTRVHFIGYVSEDDLPALYRLADVYLMLAPVELQSISTLEALASGVPVVAAHAGALPELVQDGRNGYLVPPSDPDSAGTAVMNLLADTSRREMMGGTSRQVALAHDLQATITAYERVFEETRAGRGVGGVERAAAAG